MFEHRLQALRVVAAAAALGIAFGASTRADVRSSKRDAQAMKQKVAAIAAHGEKPSRQGRRTTVTEKEVNSYLAYETADDLPRGLSSRR